jgi:signal transduction histidine kinase
MTPGDLGLRRQLARRLYPITVVAAAMIAVGPPLAYWTLQTRAMIGTRGSGVGVTLLLLGFGAGVGIALALVVHRVALDAVTLRSAQYHSASVRRAEELAALLRATRTVMADLDLKVIFERIVAEAAQIADTPHVVLLVRDADTQVLGIGAVAGAPVPPRVTTPMIGTLSGIVAATGQPLCVADVADDPRGPIAERDRQLGVVSYLGLPVRVRERVLGVLTFHSVGPREYSPDELGFLASFADQAAIAIENARLFEETQRNLRRTRALLAIAQSATATVEPAEIARGVADEARRLLGADGAVLYACDETLGEMIPRAHPELPGWVAQIDRPCPLGAAPAPVAEALLTGRSVFGLEPASATGPGCSVLVGPVRLKDRLFGALALFWWRAPHESVGNELAVLEAVAGEAALVLDHARLVSATQKQAAELKEKNAELDSFAYVVSHDLKAPLVTIHGMSSLVLEDAGAALSADARRCLGRIQANVRQMERLIMDLLAVSRIAREPRAPEPVALDDIVDDVLLALAEPIRQRGVRVARGTLATITGVPTQIEQVMANLVGNAVKYMGDQPAPTVEVGCQERGDVVECWVRDNGVGIDPAYHEKVFEYFHRLKDVDVEGSGLGLSIVRRIVEGAGGRVWVESTHGHGATFRFTWPKTGPREPVRR